MQVRYCNKEWVWGRNLRRRTICHVSGSRSRSRVKGRCCLCAWEGMRLSGSLMLLVLRLIRNKLDEGKEIELIRNSAQQRSSHFYIASNLAGSSDLCAFCSGSGSAKSWKQSESLKYFSPSSSFFKVTQGYTPL
jgi:hypothetical protein